MLTHLEGAKVVACVELARGLLRVETEELSELLVRVGSDWSGEPHPALDAAGLSLRVARATATIDSRNVSVLVSFGGGADLSPLTRETAKRAHVDRIIRIAAARAAAGLRASPEDLSASLFVCSDRVIDVMHCVRAERSGHDPDADALAAFLSGLIEPISAERVRELLTRAQR